MPETPRRSRATQVAHLGRLARLSLTDDELDHYSAPARRHPRRGRPGDRGRDPRRARDLAPDAAAERVPRGRRPAQLTSDAGAVRRAGGRGRPVPRARASWTRSEPSMATPPDAATDLTRLTASQLAELLGEASISAREVAAGAPGPDRRGRRRRSTPSCTSTPTARWPSADAVDAARAAGERRSVRWPACRWPSRTC